MWVKTLLKVLFIPPLLFIIIAGPFELIGLSAIGRFFALIAIIAFFGSIGGFFKPLPEALRGEHEAYRKSTEGRHKAFW